MIGPDLVRARRRADRLLLSKLDGQDRAAAHEMAEQMLFAAQDSAGLTLDELEEALNAIDRQARHEKLWAGIKKLTLDACEFEAPLEVDAVALRREVFELAAERRMELPPGQALENEGVLGEVAERHGLSANELLEGLYGDLRGAQKLVRTHCTSPGQLVERYELAQIQGVLLRAVRLTAVVRASDPEIYRRLFRKLKFRKLLYRLESLQDGRYRIIVDGPFSLFSSVTKYGMQLALLVPALLECDEAEIEAEVQWGKDRRSLRFQHRLSGDPTPASEGDSVRPEIEALLESMAKKPTEWSAAAAEAILDLPGVGLVVPDLRFSAPGRPPVYLELLGYWSRDAVWDRVEWAASRPPGADRVVFAVSSRLRVSEEVMPEGAGAALYVFKGSIKAKELLRQVDELSRA